MGGQNSRMVRELVADSLYIVRQTNRATYERSRAAHQEVADKLEELRRLNDETLQSAESDAQRSEVFQSFQSSVSAHKQQLDQVVRRPWGSSKRTRGVIRSCFACRRTSSPSSSSCPRATRASPSTTARSASRQR